MVYWNSSTTKNFGHLVWKMTELWLFEIFGIVWYGMAWYSLLVLSRSTTLQNIGLLTWLSLKNDWIMTV